MSATPIPMRRLKRAAPEERLAPGESLDVRKGRAKRFRLTRVDEGGGSFWNTVQEVMRAVPIPRTGQKADVVRLHLEEEA